MTSLYTVETLLAMAGLIVIFLVIAITAALVLQLWSPGNRYGPEDRPYQYGTFKWCWEMGQKFSGTVLIIALGIFGVVMLGQLCFVPFYNTF